MKKIVPCILALLLILCFTAQTFAIQIEVLTPSAGYWLNVESHYLVEQVKQMIWHETGIEPSRQKLMVEGRELQDGHALYEYGIDRDVTLDLLVNPLLSGSSASGKNDGAYDISISGVYTTYSPAAEVICVDISWDAMDFTYSAVPGEWNPIDHTYGDSSGGSWSTNKAGITVKNHSNSAVETSFSFAANSGVNVTGTFYTQKADNSYTALAADAQNLYLGTALGMPASEPPTGKVFFGVGGSTITAAQTSLGTITVRVTKSDKIRDLNTLKQTLAKYKGKSGTVTLDADIDLGSEGVLKLDHVGTDTEALTLNLNGHTITGMLYAVGSNVFVRGGSDGQYGTISYSADALGALDPSIQNGLMGAVVENQESKLEFNFLRVNASGMYALVNNGTVSSVNVFFNGGYTRGDGEIISVMNSGHLRYEETSVSNKTLLSRDEGVYVEIASGAVNLNDQDVSGYQGTYTASSDLSEISGLILSLH